MNHGELWTAAGGTYSSKPRPVLILQDDLFDATESVTVAPLTTVLADSPLLRIRIPSTDLSGLEHASDVMIDKITTVRRRNVQKRVGRVPASVLVEIERAMMTFLGLAR